MLSRPLTIAGITLAKFFLIISILSQLLATVSLLDILCDSSSCFAQTVGMTTPRVASMGQAGAGGARATS